MKFASVAAPLLLQSQTADAAQVRGPIEKVVNLLEDMKSKLTDDQAREQMVYDKYACWCEKTTARKADAIVEGKVDLRDFGQEILTQKGVVAVKTVEIEETTKDIKENEEAQEEATSIRQKENTAYQTESGEMKQAVGALEKAIIVLGEATASGFLQVNAEAKAGQQLSLVEDLVSGAPTSALERLAKLPGKSRLGLLSAFRDSLKAGHKAQYTPQSMTITGILQDMYDSFTKDLESMDSAEAEKNRDFEALIAVKQEELISLQEKLKDAEEAKAKAEQLVAEAMQSYDDTEQHIKADIEFFDATKDACTSKNEEWTKRKTLREDELKGVEKALEVLTSDEARELFGKAINKPGVQPSFMQLDSVDASSPVRKAYQVLKGVATKTKNLRLARVAAVVHLAKVGHFDEVLKAIDTMISDLTAEGEEDVKKRDQCKDEYQSIESKSKDLDWKIEKNTAKIEKLGKTIEKKEVEKAETIEQIDETEKMKVTMKKTREEENSDFLQAKKDDEDAIKLLKEAKDALADFYEKNDIEMGPTQGLFLQAEPEFERDVDRAPEAKFSGKGERKTQAKGVVGLLEHIIEDLHGEIAVSKTQEEAAQVEYEKQVKAADELIKKLTTEQANLETEITNLQQDKTDEEEDKTNNEADLKSEEDYKKDIKPDCDFIIDNFESRTEKRTAEIDGLTQAKAYLAGYKDSAAAGEGALIQGHGHVAAHSRL